jgi:uncharacterized protein
VKVVLAGGTGEVGRLLVRALGGAGHELVVLTRGGSPVPPGARGVRWDGASVGPWAAELDGADVVVGLAGRHVDCRYTAANRSEILRSRVDSTRAVGQAIAAAAAPPAVWLQMSTATIYRHEHDVDQDERAGRIGGDEPGVPADWRFSVEVAQAWEHELEAADAPATRRVALRSAVVLSPERGGNLDRLLRLVRLGAGGTAGDGRQQVSWIHHRDFVRALLWLVEHDDVDGPVNLCAPAPLPNGEFMRELRRACGVRLGLPAPRPLVHLGALVLRTEPELVLKSRRVVPGRLLEHGFTFEHPTFPEAARDLVAAWRRR